MQTNTLLEIPVSDIYVGDVYLLNEPKTVGGLTFPNNTLLNLFTGIGTLDHDVNINSDPSNAVEGATTTIVWMANLALGGHILYINGINVSAYLGVDCSTNPQFIQVSYLNGGWQIDYSQITIAQVLTLYAKLESPTFTGTPLAPTAVKATNTTQIATTAHVKLVVADYATSLSPALTGTPTAPTAGSATNTTQIATTAFVKVAADAAAAVGTAAQGTANTAGTNATNALSQLTALTGLNIVATWAAGAQPVTSDKNFQTEVIQSLDGNVTLNITPTLDAGAYAQMTFIFTYSGSYTVTAGTNCAFTTLSGTAAVVKVLTLTWDGTVFRG